MAIQRVEANAKDAVGSLTKSAAGTVTAGKIVRVEYNDAFTQNEIYDALRKIADDILRLEQ